MTYMLYGHVHNTHDEMLVHRFIMETRMTKVGSKYATEPTPIPCKRAIRATQILQCKKECDERGITVSQWCREHNLSEKSYWYYHKKLGDTLYEVARTEGMIDTAPQIDTDHMSVP